LARELRPWVFRARPFQTPLIDLARTEEQLWQKLDRESCRPRIRKAQRLGCAISLNEEVEAARVLINDSIRRLRYRTELGEAEWQALLPQHDIFLCKCQGIPLAAHVILRDPPGRARLLMSGIADRNDERFRSVVGPCNRLLHWHELQHYKAKGFRLYDFGGIELDRSLFEPNPDFKLSFGGEVVAEPMLYLAKNPALRAVLRGISAARRAVRKLPWPEAWLKAIRARL
jgi:lipid II:glycine glycyltransferase (peptidoglycan interpeptide bridge formation enzyme)